MASFGNAAWLDKFKINGNYYYRPHKCGTVGGTIAYVTIWGSRNWGPMIPPSILMGFTALRLVPAAGWVNQIATIGFLNWIMSPGGRNLSLNSPCSRQSTANLTGLAAGMTGSLRIPSPSRRVMPLTIPASIFLSGKRSETSGTESGGVLNSSVNC